MTRRARRVTAPAHTGGGGSRSGARFIDDGHGLRFDLPELALARRLPTWRLREIEGALRRLAAQHRLDGRGRMAFHAVRAVLLHERGIVPPAIEVRPGCTGHGPDPEQDP